MSEKEKYVAVEIPKVTVDSIRRQEWFRQYRDLDEFVMEGVRSVMDRWARTEGYKR